MPNYDLAPVLLALEASSDAAYRDFNQSLIPGRAIPALGVRVPVLRGVARDILRGDWRGFLDATRDDPLHELRMLHAIVLSGARCGIAEKIALTDAFLPRVDNWAVCDALCAGYRAKPGEMDELFAFVCGCAESPSEFRRRFGLVMMMNRFRDPPYVDRVMAIYRGFRHEGYYARMGAAWGLATLFLARREAVLDILRDGVLDGFTHDKTIQKLCESYRVSDADKQLARALRRGRSRT